MSKFNITYKELANNKFIRFLVVGGINTLFGYSVFAIFIYLGFHYTIASFLSTVIGVLFNFKTLGKLVFKNNSNALIFKFFVVYAITYVINISLLRVLKTLGINMYIAGAILILPLAVLSFLLNKKFVFKG